MYQIGDNNTINLRKLSKQQLDYIVDQLNNKRIEEDKNKNYKRIKYLFNEIMKEIIFECSYGNEFLFNNRTTVYKAFGVSGDSLDRIKSRYIFQNALVVNQAIIDLENLLRITDENYFITYDYYLLPHYSTNRSCRDQNKLKIKVQNNIDKVLIPVNMKLLNKNDFIKKYKVDPNEYKIKNNNSSVIYNIPNGIEGYDKKEYGIFNQLIFIDMIKLEKS